MCGIHSGVAAGAPGLLAVAASPAGRRRFLPTTAVALRAAEVVSATAAAPGAAATAAVAAALPLLTDAGADTGRAINCARVFASYFSSA